MSVHEPITPENLCVALNRGTSLLAPRDVLLAYHHWRWVAHLPGQRLAFMADTAYARQRLARERQLLQLLADRAHFEVPRIEWVDPHGHWDVGRKVPGDAGHWSGTHHQRIVEEPAVAHQTGKRLGEILAELHRVITLEEARQLAPLEAPLATPLEHIRRNMAMGIEDATLKGQVREIFARFDALEIGVGEVVLVHGDLASQNVAFAPETSEVIGIYDFEDMACVDRHWDFKYVHSYPALFQRALLEAYQRCTGIAPDVQRITLYHALAARALISRALTSKMLRVLPKSRSKACRQIGTPNFQPISRPLNQPNPMLRHRPKRAQHQPSESRACHHGDLITQGRRFHAARTEQHASSPS
jgi:aminoglycoside phosphotransferase